MPVIARSVHSAACTPLGWPGLDARAGGALTGEAAVRRALRAQIAADRKASVETIDEFWLPQSHERADMAVIGRVMAAYEIKTERDTLRRLPRQAAAYGRVFDRCTAVVASKHADAAIDILPEWWGIVDVAVNGSVTFRKTRKPQPNHAVDPEILVRLLWRDEVIAALLTLGVEPHRRATRLALWSELLDVSDLKGLRTIVRRTLRRRVVEAGWRQSRFTR